MNKEVQPWIDIADPSLQVIMNKISHLMQLGGYDLRGRVMKLTEELGELSEAVLSAEQEPGAGYKYKTIADVNEEACDVILVALSILVINKVKYNDNLRFMLMDKLLKFEQALTMELALAGYERSKQDEQKGTE